MRDAVRFTRLRRHEIAVATYSSALLDERNRRYIDIHYDELAPLLGGRPAHRRRLSVKPGLTCLWQVSGRNNVRDFRDWVRLDLEYIDNWSFWLDLKILWRTIPVVLVGTGAK